MTTTGCPAREASRLISREVSVVLGEFRGQLRVVHYQKTRRVRLMEKSKKRKLNPIWAFLLLCFNFTWYCAWHGHTSKGVWLDYDTGGSGCASDFRGK